MFAVESSSRLLSSKWLDRTRALLKWGGWFTLVNALLMGIIGIRYLLSAPMPQEGLAQFYLFTAYVGHFAFLAYVSYILIILPLTILIPV